MLIVDAQAHIWENSTPERPWPPAEKPPQRAEPYTMPELLQAMDDAGVDRTVIVPPSWVGDNNDTAIEAARAHPDRLAVMGRISLLDEATGKRWLPRWRDQPGMLGLRLTFQTPRQRAILESGAADWLWPVAEASGVPVMLLVPELLDHARDIAVKHPRLRLTIDHMGARRGKKDDEAFADIEQLLALSRHANVAVKATALPDFSTAPYPCLNLHAYLQKIIAAFGPRRVFWGADHTRLPCSYREAVTLFTEDMPWLDSESLEWIMGRAVCDWLDWPYSG